MDQGGHDTGEDGRRLDRLEERVLALDRLLTARLDSLREQVRDTAREQDAIRQVLATTLGEHTGERDRREAQRSTSQLRVLAIGVGVSIVIGIGSIITAIVLALLRHP